MFPSACSAEDVVHFLLSRHGIQADMDFVKENLMPGLAGALGDNPATAFDLVAIVSILLIPYLKQEMASVDSQDGIFSKVLDMILKDVTGSTVKPVLDQAMMQTILESYGKFAVPPAVLDEMLLTAGVGQAPKRLNAEVLMMACTSDVLLYDNCWDESATTHYDDIFGGTTLDAEGVHSNKASLKLGLSDRLADEEQSSLFGKSIVDDGKQVKRVYTAPSIDGIAENYNSKTFVAGAFTLDIVHIQYDVVSHDEDLQAFGSFLCWLSFLSP